MTNKFRCINKICEYYTQKRAYFRKTLQNYKCQDCGIIFTKQELNKFELDSIRDQSYLKWRKKKKSRKIKQLPIFETGQDIINKRNSFIKKEQQKEFKSYYPKPSEKDQEVTEKEIDELIKDYPNY